jgi:hypothetical protein
MLAHCCRHAATRSDGRHGLQLARRPPHRLVGGGEHARQAHELLACALRHPCAVIHRADVRDEQGGTRRVVAIGAPGYRAAESAAYPLIDGCVCGLDMTRRDPRRVARRNGWPRGLGQDIEQGSAISAIVPVHGVVIERGEAALTVNGQPL